MKTDQVDENYGGKKTLFIKKYDWLYRQPYLKPNCNVKKDEKNKRNLIFERLVNLEKENDELEEELNEELKKIKKNIIYNTVNDYNQINN